MTPVLGVSDQCYDASMEYIHGKDLMFICLKVFLANSDSTGMQHLLHTEMQVNRNDLFIASMQYCSEFPLCDYDCNHQMI